MRPRGLPGAGMERARDHLSNERTYLAWIRTALATLGFGFVLARMGAFLRALPVATAGPRALGLDPVRASVEFVITGAVFLVLGTVLCGWAGWHYTRTRRAIDAGEFVPAGTSVLLLTLGVLLGGLIITGLAIGLMLGDAELRGAR